MTDWFSEDPVVPSFMAELQALEDEHQRAREEREFDNADPKPRRRVIEDKEGWEILRRIKLAPCRLCGAQWLPQLHHLVSRSLGGDDVPDNLVPLCAECHQAVEEHFEPACVSLRESLTDRERAYIVGKKGADYLDRRYPVAA